MQFSEIIKINTNKLFDGAIDLDWFLDNQKRAVDVATSYVFHGPKNHTGNMNAPQNKKLTDTITMTEVLVNAVSKPQKSKIILGIAGYGAGKSHFSIMISELLNSNDSIKNKILDNIAFVDKTKAISIESNLKIDDRPVFILPINGINNDNLTKQFAKVVKKALIRDGQPIDFMNEVDSKFNDLCLNLSNYYQRDEIKSILESCDCSSLEELKTQMDLFDDVLFNSIVNELNKRNINIPISSSTTKGIKELIPFVYKNICGPTKHYRSMLVLFDEFGRYMMFSAEDEKQAGSGVMQQLFEGINGNENYAITMFGLSQLDLEEYRSTTSSNSKFIDNNKFRYVTRFSGADKYYLSVNFETLINNLIKVTDESYLPNLTSIKSNPLIKQKKDFLNRMFISSKNLLVWTNFNEYSNYVIGCWPLDSFALWLVVYLSSGINILQQRSALNILQKCFIRMQNENIVKDFLISAVDLFDSGLDTEFLNSEDSSLSHYQITTNFFAVLERYRQNLTQNEAIVLKAIVLSSKMHAAVNNFGETKQLISYLTLLSLSQVSEAIEKLMNEYNIIQEGLNNLYDIVSDAPSKNEFRALFTKRYFEYENIPIDQKITYVQRYLQSADFSQESADVFKFVEPTFAVKHDIKTNEWKLKPDLLVTVNPIEDFKNYIKNNQPFYEDVLLATRGTVLYVLLESEEDIFDLKESFKSILHEEELNSNEVFPLLVVLLKDNNSEIIQNSLKYQILSQFNEEEKAKFKVFIHKEIIKCKQDVSKILDESNRKNIFLSGLNKTQSKRSSEAEQIFETIYPNIISFPMEGFSDEKGKGFNEIVNFINALLVKPTLEYIGSKLVVSQRNHCLFLIGKKWGMFDRLGNIQKKSFDASIVNAFENFDRELEEQDQINAYSIFEKLSNAPYGLNKVGALLLVFLYYYGRFDSIICLKEQQSENLEKIIPTVDKSCFKAKRQKGFTVNELTQIDFIKRVLDDAEWVALLNKWKDEILYSKMVEYSDKAQVLKKKHIILPSRYLDLYAELINKTNLAKEKLKEFESLWKSFTNRINNSCEKNSIYHLYLDLATFNHKLSEIMDEPDCWDSEKDTVINEFFYYYQHDYIEENLDKWIKNNPFVIRDLDQYSCIKKKYIYLSKALKELSLSKYAKKLDDQVQLFDSYLQDLRKYNDFVVSYNKKILPIRKDLSKKIMQRFNIYKEYDSFLDDLLTSMNAFPENLLKELNVDLEEQKEEISQFKKNIDSMLQSYDHEFREILNSPEINSISDLFLLQKKVSELLVFYSGNANEEDLSDLKQEIEDLFSCFYELDKETDSIEDLNTVYQKIVKKFDEEDTGDFLIDHDDVLKKYYENCKNKIIQKSNDFVHEIELKYQKASDYSSWSQVKDKIERKPVYVTSFDCQKLDKISLKIDENLSSYKILNILTLVKKLSEKEKEQLILKLKEGV